MCPFVNIGKENSGDIKLHYEDYGEGKPVILIHGYPLSGRAWEKQIPALLDAGYRVITYDRRGFGNSSQPWSGYDPDTFTEDLHKLVTKLDLHNFVLVGHSMGGEEIAHYIGKYGTKDVSKVVFISAVPPFLRKAGDNPEGLDGSLFEELKNAVIEDRPAFMTKFCTDFYNMDVFEGKRVSKQAYQASWNTAIEASPKGSIDCVETWGTDFREDLKRIDIPTLVIHGDQDRIVPFPNSGKRMPDFVKDSKLVVVKDGPHGIAWTHAEEVNRELLDFLG
ncbi:MAG TPA: alpha/beta hydrolase [Methanobacterium sp.]|nr:alpha/beta hydrolase [Methanobacterium sp.]